MSTQPVTPGRGYDFVKVGQTLRVSDQVWLIVEKRWRTLTGLWIKPAVVTQSGWIYPYGYYRRKKAKK